MGGVIRGSLDVDPSRQFWSAIAVWLAMLVGGMACLSVVVALAVGFVLGMHAYRDCEHESQLRS